MHGSELGSHIVAPEVDHDLLSRKGGVEVHNEGTGVPAHGRRPPDLDLI
jgi:hypothetical protein